MLSSTGEEKPNIAKTYIEWFIKMNYVLWGKREGERPLGRPRRRLENNIR
jgi:hypothetical protein